MTTAAKKERLLEEETALNQTETAAILGVRPRDVGEYMQPSFYRGSKPRYIAREVLKVRDRWVKATGAVRSRNRKMLQTAAQNF